MVIQWQDTVLDLKDDVYIVLTEKKHTLAPLTLFIDAGWIGQLSYLVNIFEKHNDLNVSLQAQRTNI